MNNLILASGSARRIALLKTAGIDPIIKPAEIDETLPEGISPRDAVMFLAFKKALHVESECLGTYDGFTIIGADTVVALGDQIMGKPKDKDEALEILLSLSGKSHKVYTGVALIKVGESTRTVFVDETTVYFKSYNSAELEDYLNTDEPYDKAGAYAIQGYFGRYVANYDGDYNNVIGLPTKRLIPMLYSSPFGG